ncbi:hypothetical protein LTR66_006126 [Elasticomyces elasticus]|nr:hypothetical protein LTR66_006126 [Elasticomyces elasticus]
MEDQEDAQESRGLIANLISTITVPGSKSNIYVSDTKFDHVLADSPTSSSTTGRGAAHPWGIVPLAPDLISQQGYDVAVELRMPRTPSNTGLGNFMIETRLFGPSEQVTRSGAATTTHNILSTLDVGAMHENLLAHSRRPAILIYYSPIIEFVHKVFALPYYVIGWRHEEETLRVSLFESISFAKGWRNVPTILRLEIQGERRMQVYTAKMIFRARFQGLRWWMYNWKMTSAWVFVGGFWIVEMLCTGAAWALLVFAFSRNANEGLRSPKSETEQQYGSTVKTEDAWHDSIGIKKEEYPDDDAEDLSDTSRTFPTYAGQPPLRYSTPKIKKEEDMDFAAPSQVPPLTQGEADDEDEDADFILDRDSGLGTSMESSSGRREILRRRRSKMFGSGG